MAVEEHVGQFYSVMFNCEDRPMSREELRSAMRECDALIPTITGRIDEDIIETPGGRGKILENFGAADHIDLHAARQTGVTVTNTPDARTEAAVGLDVYEREPEVHPGLLANPRAVLLPHLGSAAEESRTATRLQAAGNLRAFFAEEEPPNRVA